MIQFDAYVYKHENNLFLNFLNLNVLTVDIICTTIDVYDIYVICNMKDMTMID